MNEFFALGRSTISCLRRCLSSIPLIFLVLFASWILLLVRQMAPAIGATLFGHAIQMAAFIATTLFLGRRVGATHPSEARRRQTSDLPAAVTLSMTAVLLHLLLVAVSVWPNFEMIPFVSALEGSALIFFLVGVLPSAKLISGAEYTLDELLKGAFLGLPVVLLVLGIGMCLRDSRFASSLSIAVFDVLAGVFAATSYFAVDSRLACRLR